MENKTILFFKLACTLCLMPLHAVIQQNIVIISASHNNQVWVERYVSSLLNQTYNNWTLIYIDDFSTDRTVAHMQKLVDQYNLHHKVTLIKNDARHGHLYNQYHAIHTLPAHALVVILDADDWFYDETALETINNVYQDENVWITYGQFWYWKKDKKGFCREIPPDIIKQNGIRQITWRTSHARTFYAGLFQKIRMEDLFYNGSFFPKCADVATMLPMIEMAGIHSRFISKILYMYNDDNPISFHYDPAHQRELENYIRALPPYAPLPEKPW